MNKIYCNESLGKILYEDKMKTISNIDILGEFLSIYSQNKSLDKKLFEDIKILQNKKIIKDIIRIDNINDKDLSYNTFINKLKIMTNEFNIIDGINDVGYIFPLEKIEYTNDLKIIYNLGLITKDIIKPIVSKKNLVYKELNYEQIDFINKINFEKDKNILIIGNDLGYILYLLKNSEKNIFIYNNDSNFENFCKNYIYDKIEKKCNINYINDLSECNFDIFDKIILETSFDLSFYYFVNYHFERYLDKLYCFNIDKIILKLKEDLRDLIYTGKEDYYKVIFDEFKDFKDIDKKFKSAELEFIERVDIYLLKNNIFFDNYKNFNRFIKNNNILYEILKEES